ncbi:MAG: hypothetical protein Q9159_004817 [Coniocarpon cinnabarinum]
MASADLSRSILTEDDLGAPLHFLLALPECGDGDVPPAGPVQAKRPIYHHVAARRLADAVWAVMGCHGLSWAITRVLRFRRLVAGRRLMRRRQGTKSSRRLGQKNASDRRAKQIMARTLGGTARSGMGSAGRPPHRKHLLVACWVCRLCCRSVRLNAAVRTRSLEVPSVTKSTHR